MRTTLTLEKDVAARLKAEARRTGRAFKDVVNECLRYGLTRPEVPPDAPPFRVKSRDFGALQPGVSLDNIGELLERVAGPDHR